jgi:hypothetical protein
MSLSEKRKTCSLKCSHKFQSIKMADNNVFRKGTEIIEEKDFQRILISWNCSAI